MPFSDETREALRHLGIDHGGSHDDAAEPIDLRTIPVEQWEQYLCYPVTLPDPVAKYLIHAETETTTVEKDNLEQAIETFHHVQPPWVIVLRDGVARLMKE